jgi:hypothetical protein
VSINDIGQNVEIAMVLHFVSIKSENQDAENVKEVKFVNIIE